MKRPSEAMSCEQDVAGAVGSGHLQKRGVGRPARSHANRGAGLTVSSALQERFLLSRRRSLQIAEAEFRGVNDLAFDAELPSSTR
jgi:hypothetical protein